MGCITSQYADAPVTGFSAPFEVLGSRFVSQAPITLRMREKMWSWSGDDFSIKDMNEQPWFKIQGRPFSVRNKGTLLDYEGNPVANYRQKLWSMSRASHIYIEQGERKFVYATIKVALNCEMAPSANIYLHQPPVDIENVTTEGMEPQMRATGDGYQRNFDIVMENTPQGVLKIAQIEKPLQCFSLDRDYYLSIGPNADVAFIVMVTFALDELYNQSNN